MKSVFPTWLTDQLYSALYSGLRKRYFGKRAIGKRTIHRAVCENLSTLNERELYFIRLYAVHGYNVRHVAKDADVTYRRARRVIDIATRKLTSPQCLVNAHAIPEFKHLGNNLNLSRILSISTINRLKQSGIETDGDLLFWHNLGPKYLFRIPEVGEGRVVAILSHLGDVGLIS